MFKFYKSLFLFPALLVFSMTTLLAETPLAEYDKVVTISHLDFLESDVDENYTQKTAESVRKINSLSSEYEEYLVKLTGDTSCGIGYEKFASRVEDALLRANIEPNKILITYYRVKNSASDCKRSRSVGMDLYLKKPLQSPFKTLVVLLEGRKKNSSIIVSTLNASVVVDKPFEAVSIDSKQTISPPKKISKEELNVLSQNLLSSSEEKEYNFVLYMNKLDLRSDSKAQVKDILDLLASLKNPYINIVGNTDTTGNPKDNLRLGLKRAEVVKNIIKASGVKYLKIDISSQSEGNLAVPTPDNTKELRNRRVEISIR